MSRCASVALAVLATVVAAAACSDDGRELRPPGPDQTLSITTAPTTTVSGEVVTTVAPPLAGESTALPAPLLVTPWSETGEIDQVYSCVGQDVSPALSWSNVPASAVELAVVVTDPDAGGWVHWVIAGLSPDAATFFQQGLVPPEAVEALNGFGRVGWGGPCPPAGERHTYDATLYVLDRPSGVTSGQSAASAIAAIQAAAVSTATVSGDFGG